MSNPNCPYVRKNPDAKRVYDYIEEHGPVTAMQMGMDLPDISPNQRSHISAKLRNLGLITGRRVPMSGRVTIEWRVLR